MLPAAPPFPIPRPPSRTLAIGADGAALARGDLGAGAVLGFVADHVIAQHVAVVADTDPAGLGFPYVSVVVPEAVLYAGDWWDWGKRGKEGLSAALEAPHLGAPGIPALPVASPVGRKDTFRFSISRLLLLPVPPPFPKSLKAHLLLIRASDRAEAPGQGGYNSFQFSGI